MNLENLENLESPPNSLPTTPDSPTANQAISSDALLEILAEPEEKRRTGAKWIVASGLVLTVGIAGWLGYRRFFTPPVEPVVVPTTAVDIGSVEVTITESGTVELDGQQTFKSPSDVTVESVQVEERQRVAAGTVLLELRDRALQRELNNQQVSIQKSANLLARQQESIQEQQDKLQTAQERFQDSQSLFDRGFISEDAYRQDEQGVDDAISSLKDAQVALTNAELDSQNEQLSLQTILTEIADNQLVSPIDAVVLNIDIKAGDGVQQGENLLTIGDPNKETVRLQLSTLNAAKVETGMPVEVSMIGPDPQVFSGRISRVSPQVISPSGGGGEQQGTVEAEAILNEPSNGALFPGSSVSVEVILDRRQSVVVAPLTAIQIEGARRFVWIKDEEGLAQQQAVKVGLRNLQVAEIISGLRAGDEIVPALPPDAELTPGMPLADAAAMPSGMPSGGPSDFIEPRE